MIRRNSSKINAYLTLIYINNYRTEETETFLNMLQRLLISEKKKKSQHQEIQKIPKSYPYSPFTHWDLVNRKYILFYFL